MKSKVFFANMRADAKENLYDKLNALLDRVHISSIIKENDLVAVKLHFGESGNTAFIPPHFIRKIVEKVKQYYGQPFITDTNTLYKGDRSQAISHLTLAVHHGYSFSVVEAPLIIADGLRGNCAKKVNINQEIFKDVFIAADLFYADCIISVAHFKGHELTGFGGALKNIGMGGASRQGKLAQHSNISPKVSKKLCTGCGNCKIICPQGAIALTKSKSTIVPERCIGCAECINICSQGAIQIQWNETTATLQKKMVEYAFGLLRNKKEKVIFLNFLINISPSCDCYGYADVPIVPNIGILSSTDPVAIDQASVDLVNGEFELITSFSHSRFKKGEDKFRGLYPEVDWGIQLKYAEKLGLGFRSYSLIHV